MGSIFPILILFSIMKLQIKPLFLQVQINKKRLRLVHWGIKVFNPFCLNVNFWRMLREREFYVCYRAENNQNM